MSESAPKGFKLKVSSEVSIADIVAMLSVLIGCSIVYGGQVEQTKSNDARMRAIEASIDALRPTDARLARVEQVTAMQTNALARIEDKLDRVIEREKERP